MTRAKRSTVSWSPEISFPFAETAPAWPYQYVFKGKPERGEKLKSIEGDDFPFPVKVHHVEAEGVIVLRLKHKIGYSYMVGRIVSSTDTNFRMSLLTWFLAEPPK